MADRMTLKNIIIALAVVGGALVTADLFGLRYDKVKVGEVPGFYALVSFVTVFAVVLFARAMRPLLGVREDYYGKSDEAAEREVNQDV